mgnify:CR=1 FL=1
MSFELTEENKHQLYIPKGFAHGFIVLSNFATFSYKVDYFYSPKHLFKKKNSKKERGGREGWRAGTAKREKGAKEQGRTLYTG